MPVSKRSNSGNRTEPNPIQRRRKQSFTGRTFRSFPLPALRGKVAAGVGPPSSPSLSLRSGAVSNKAVAATDAAASFDFFDRWGLEIQ